MKTTLKNFILLICCIAFASCNSKLSLTKKRYSKGYHLEVNSKRNVTSPEINKSSDASIMGVEHEVTASLSKSPISTNKQANITETNTAIEIKSDLSITTPKISHASKPSLNVTKKESSTSDKLNSIIESNKKLHKKNTQPLWYDWNNSGFGLIGIVGSLIGLAIFFLIILLINSADFGAFFALLFLGFFAFIIVGGLVVLVLIIINAD